MQTRRKLEVDITWKKEILVTAIRPGSVDYRLIQQQSTGVFGGCAHSDVVVVKRKRMRRPCGTRICADLPAHA